MLLDTEEVVVVRIRLFKLCDISVVGFRVTVIELAKSFHCSPSFNRSIQSETFFIGEVQEPQLIYVGTLFLKIAPRLCFLCYLLTSCERLVPNRDCVMPRILISVAERRCGLPAQPRPSTSKADLSRRSFIVRGCGSVSQELLRGGVPDRSLGMAMSRHGFDIVERSPRDC